MDSVDQFSDKILNTFTVHFIIIIIWTEDRRSGIPIGRDPSIYCALIGFRKLGDSRASSAGCCYIKDICQIMSCIYNFVQNKQKLIVINNLLKDYSFPFLQFVAISRCL